VIVCQLPSPRTVATTAHVVTATVGEAKSTHQYFAIGLPGQGSRVFFDHQRDMERSIDCSRPFILRKSHSHAEPNCRQKNPQHSPGRGQRCGQDWID
jgi:hypothetical protein